MMAVCMFVLEERATGKDWFWLKILDDGDEVRNFIVGQFSRRS